MSNSREFDKEQYYADAKEWYYDIYLEPLRERSVLMVAAVFMFLIALLVGLSMYSMLPLERQIEYGSFTEDVFKKRSKIAKASTYANDPISSIAKILSEYYVIKRESYGYEGLKSQLSYIKTHSSSLIFKKFYNYITLDNPQSPVLKYQKDVYRVVNVVSTRLKNNEQEFTITFYTTAIHEGKAIERIMWEAQLNYEIDRIDLRAKHGTPFKFVVTNYKLKLLNKEDINL